MGKFQPGDRIKVDCGGRFPCHGNIGRVVSEDIINGGYYVDVLPRCYVRPSGYWWFTGGALIPMPPGALADLFAEEELPTISSDHAPAASIVTEPACRCDLFAMRPHDEGCAWLAWKRRA